MKRARRAENPLQALPGLLHAGFAAAALPVLRELSRAAMDLVFPPACLNCREATDIAGSLCATCWAKVRFIERPFCDRLGTPFAVDLGDEGLLSPEAVANPPVYARARAVARFEDGPVRQLVHRLKCSDRMELAKPLGVWMARAGGELLVDADLLVPVPLHRHRLVARRFNQANALAQAISAASGVRVDPLALIRVKPTRAPRLGCPARSGRSICKAPFVCRRRWRRKWRAAPLFSSTMS